MIAGLDKSELVLLKFSEKEASQSLKWKHSKEFEYRHQMFDIVETVSKGDSILYWCWSDNAETELNLKLQEFTAAAWGDNPQKKQKQDQLNQFYKSLYFTSSIDSLLATRSENSKHSCFIINCESLSIKPPSPPPQEILVG